MTLLEISGVSKRFGGVDALRDVGFVVASGETLGLIGPNGSGKTTLFNVISGLVKPDSGSIRMAGSELVGLAPPAIARLGVARTFQISRPMAGLTVLENLLPGMYFGADRPPVDEVEAQAMELLGLVGLSDKAIWQAHDLTLWETRRLELARALGIGSRLLLLDEIFAGLAPSDVGATIDVVARVKEETGTTIVLVEHVMKATMALCDRVVVLASGRLLTEGLPRDVVGHPRVLEVYLGSKEVPDADR